MRGEDLTEWHDANGKRFQKVIGVPETAEELQEAIRAHNECCGAKLVAVLITDQGRTCFGCPTMTVLAIGPTTRGELPKFVQRMQLL